MLLPKTITIGDFEKKALIVPGRTFVDEDTRVLLMQEASDFSNFASLNIDREFFTFLKNSKYLFSFFEELAVEMVDIQSLKSHDTYANYEEHLEILQRLQEKYIQLLDERGYVDKITLPRLYRLNRRYLSAFEAIEFHLEGYLNRFERMLFTQIAEAIPFIIHLHTNRFNQKMIEAFESFDFSLEEDHYYRLDLQNRTILHAEPLPAPTTHFQIDAQESPVDQIAFVKQKLYDFIQKGYAPEEITVILPKASSAQLLDLFDDENNFNFAMGFPFTQTLIYQKLDALYHYFIEKSPENKERIKALGFTTDRVHALQKEWSAKVDQGYFASLLAQIVPESQSEAYTLFDQERRLFERLLPTLLHYPFHKILHLFLNRLSQCTLDDTRGGKITVLEILETRGIRKDALIVIDFNEGVLPSVSRKDLFLSSAIRKNAQLPTPADRENLQKYYYKRIFDQAKEVAISYVEDEQNQPSRFLDELAISGERHDHGDLKSILFPAHPSKPHYLQEDLHLAYDFTKSAISASSLKSFLDCKRRYYFRYILKIGDFEIPKESSDERNVGNLLHEALCNIYRNQPRYLEREALMLDLQRELYLKSDGSPTLRFLIDIWLERLKPFVEKEIARFEEGYTVYQTEKQCTAPFEKLTLTGTIDRIDKKGEHYYILDYKSGKIPETTSKKLETESDFQLQFYYLLTRDLGNVEEAYYYDLKNATLHAEPLFDEKLVLLYQHLETLMESREFNFTMTEDLKKCQYCPYQKICNRIL